MRKHDVRKWLHAILDLLPVILIPVFMIYSHRHTIDSGSIDVSQNLAVDFNQLSVINNFEYTSQEEGSIYILNGEIDFKSDNIYLIQVSQTYSYNTVSRNIPILRYNYALTSITDYFSIVDGNLSVSTSENVNLISGSHYIYLQANSNFTAALLYWVNAGDVSNNYYHVNFYNLTQMFGRGNEPTYSQFLNYYPLQDYAYTLSRKELLKNISTIIYDDTDIMSQFTYQLYNSVDKYFNMGNVFHLNEVYDWFNLNIFNGNAPIYIFIVYQIVLYELIMDLLMLLYALFMWFIDMIEKLMEKPLNSIK